jgi:hypothetical protein
VEMPRLTVAEPLLGVVEPVEPDGVLLGVAV